MADTLYVQVEVGFPHSKLVDRARVKLNVSTNEAIGLFVRLWLAVLERHTGGSLVDRSDSWIEESAGWRGAEGAFAKLVREHHLDPDQRIRDWQEKYGALEAKRLRQRDKKRAQRHPVPGTGMGTVPGTEGGPLITSTTAVAVSSSVPANPKTELVGREERQVDPEKIVQFGEFAEDVAAVLRGSRSPRAVLATLDMQVQEGTPPLVVGRAIRDMAANGEQFNAARFRGFLRSLSRDPEQAAAPGASGGAEAALERALAWVRERGGWRHTKGEEYKAALPLRVRKAISACGGVSAFEEADPVTHRSLAKRFCVVYATLPLEQMGDTHASA
jgi:hypothetical protein